MSAQPTTPQTAANATLTDALDLSQPQLLGLFTGGEAPRALLRDVDGSTVMVSPEDQTSMGDVMAIAESYILLRQGATIRRLTLPV